MYLYHTPKLSGLLKSILPERTNEIVGLQHMKLYIFDDTVLISGWAAFSLISARYCFSFVLIPLLLERICRIPTLRTDKIVMLSSRTTRNWLISFTTSWLPLESVHFYSAMTARCRFILAALCILIQVFPKFYCQFWILRRLSLISLFLQEHLVIIGICCIQKLTMLWALSKTRSGW